jgi:hypothetical protein
MTHARVLALAIGFAALAMLLPACQDGAGVPPAPPPTAHPAETQPAVSVTARPLVASWLAKKDELIAGAKPYDIVMSGWFTPEEASQLKAHNPDALLLAGLSLNWDWDNPAWMSFLETVASYGRAHPLAVSEEMYLHHPDGSRCAFGWASESWGHEEIYATDARNAAWAELITAFYETTLAQPQHDGIIVDMVLERSLFPDVLTDQEWTDATTQLMRRIEQVNTADKMVVLNAGRDFSEIDAYAGFMDGYVMENCLGEQFGATFDEALGAAGQGYVVVYAVDTDDSGQQNLNRMRLGLALSLLTDDTYCTYDFGPRDHGQAWWYPEYDVQPGEPLGPWYQEGESYRREFDNGLVVGSPHAETLVTFDAPHTDVTTGVTGTQFSVEQGDGRIYVRAD